MALIRYLIVWIGFSIHRANYCWILFKVVGEKNKFYTLALLLLWHFPQFVGLLSVGRDALLELFVGVICCPY
jgi:hypothetical protein